MHKMTDVLSVHRNTGSLRYARRPHWRCPLITVKKYGNRRLYDTEASRYVTLEELAERIRDGVDARILDAATGEDLTQATLTQIIIEGRGAAKLFAVPLLTQLVRLDDDALAEFFGRYVTWALELYLATKRSARALGPLDPFPLLGNKPLFRMLGQAMPQWSPPTPVETSAPATPPPPPPPIAEPSGASSGSTMGEVAELRRELEALKRSVRRRKR